MISGLRLILPTLRRLGPGAVAAVAAYRLACLSGLYRYRLPAHFWSESGEFFAPSQLQPPVLSQTSRESLLAQSDSLLAGDLDYFSCIRKTIGNPPDWFLDPFSGNSFSQEGHWSTLNEFAAGDIKIVWEASRFEWAPLLARAWRLTCDDRYLRNLNTWLLNWVEHNPVNAGVNWKCGQEASIRLINLLLAARLLGSHTKPSSSLVKLVAVHCARILSTIRYAVAQNNNHGTSEAAALFIGGAWLMAQPETASLVNDARSWRNAGRKWLENRVTSLVAEDGSFSQYSVNYHRVLIDTLSQVELWREELKESPFTERYAARCRVAVDWLASMTDADSGNAPNMGANDGARLYNLSSAPYRDFRPTVQLASVLFLGKRAYPDGAWDEPLLWLGRNRSIIDPPSAISVIHKDGGDLVLHGDNSRGIIRFASFRFRPSHADCLHLDLWQRGDNVLRDGGTFSYNTDPHWLDYFSGTESHNTVQFDDRNQMPRIGRFLFGEWLKMDEDSDIRREGNRLSWTGAYTDWKGAQHRRTVDVCGNTWHIVDEIRSFQHKAVLRWRLMPVEWFLTGNTCDSERARMRVSTTAPLRRLELVNGWESLHYQQKTELPVLEIEVGPGTWTIETEIFLKD